MTDDITKHVEALRANVPAMAEQAFIYLSCEAWRGWKPKDIFEVQWVINSLLDRVAAGSAWAVSAGLTVFAGEDEEGVFFAQVSFQADWATMVDPFEGTIAVVGV